jgi:hypothetical protein
MFIAKTAMAEPRPSGHLNDIQMAFLKEYEKLEK